MPEHKCAVCGTPVFSKYSGSGLSFFCKDCEGKKVDDTIDRLRDALRKPERKSIP